MTQHEYSDLYQKLMELEIEYRLPLVLYYLNQYTVKEISQIFNLGESAVKMRLSMGRKKMRQMYEQEDTVLVKSGIGIRIFQRHQKALN